MNRAAVLLLLVSGAAFAQAPRGTDVGVWVNRTTYSSTAGAEPISAVEVGLAERNGYGVSVNRFFRDRLSLALSADQLRARARLAQTETGDTLDAGPARVRACPAPVRGPFT